MTSPQPPSSFRYVDGGLLTFLEEHALDDDYAAVAERTAAARRTRPLLTIATIALATLLTVVAATQTFRNAGDEQAQRGQLMKQLDRERKDLDVSTATAAALRHDITDLEDQAVTGLTATTRDRTVRLGIWVGTEAVSGSGVRVTADDAATPDSRGRGKVLDTDLQELVNGLWESGAEAIAINGERLTTLSAIRLAGSAITVNYHSLARPYVIEAIGDPASIPGRFAQTRSGAAWLDLQQQVGLKFSMTTVSGLNLPGAPAPNLRFATSGQEKTQ